MTDHDERDPTSAEGPQDAVPTPPQGVGAQPDAAHQPAPTEPAATPSEPGQPGAAGPAKGAMRYQDPATTAPREPTLGERRAREQAKKRETQAAEAAAAEDKRKRKKRKRLLIGAGATVGVVAVVAIGYAASQPDEVVARCVEKDSDVVADESNCVNGQELAANQGYGGGFGGGFFPIFLSGGRQYYYNYGGTGEIGQRATGGTTVAPKGASVRTSSGSTVTRGGFGVSKGGSSSGGSSSGGSSSGS